MRKITLFAVAALSVSTAMAGATLPVAKTTNVKKSLEAPVRAISYQTEHKAFDSILKDEAASDVAATASELPLYVAKPAFYLGSMAPSLTRYMTVNLAFLPSSGKYGFSSLFEADSYAWSWEDYVLNSGASKRDTVLMSSSDTDLDIELEPLKQFSAPTLTLSAEQSVLKYSNPAKYFAGGSPFFYGLYDAEEMPEDEPELEKMYGASMCPVAVGENFFRGMEFAVNRGAEGYNENGVLESEWGKYFAGYSDVKLNGYGYILDYTGKPYQMSALNLLCAATTTEATSLTAKVYAINEEGKIDRNTVIGEGTAILPEGQTAGFVYVKIRALNAAGLPSNKPMVIDGSCYVELTGLENPAVTQFAPFQNGNILIPKSQWGQEIWNYVYPNNCLANISAVNDETKETETRLYYVAGGYLLDETNQDIISSGQELMMYFIIDYPIVANAEDGTSVFNANIPVAGGSQTLYVTGTEDIEQLYSDESITAEASADWIDFEVGYDETNQVATVTVSAEALPDGQNGREGTIQFTGYACDFTVNVLQGESGISAVVANGNGASQYFDLQGRRLTSAPAKGFYIERNGTHAATKLAR